MANSPVILWWLAAHSVSLSCLLDKHNELRAIGAFYDGRNRCAFGYADYLASACFRDMQDKCSLVDWRVKRCAELALVCCIVTK